MIKLEKINLPFEGSRWVLTINGGVFGTYRTKAEALKDAKAYGLRVK